MDKVLIKQMLFIADTYGLLLCTHMGRRAVTSCKHAVHLLLKKIHATQQTKKKEIISLLMLNISRTFNNILHQRLIHCLQKQRIPILMVKWIQSFLIRKFTCIKLLEGMLERFLILIEIPQGSLILLILYLFYNADLLNINIDKNRLRHGLVTGYINNTNIIVNRRNTEEIIKTLLILHKKAELQA